MRYKEIKISSSDLKDIENLFNTEGITMVRLGVKDNSYAQKIKFIKSARLEGNGKYNIRIGRKVVKRNLSKDEAINEFGNIPTDSLLYGIFKPTVTKRNYTISELIEAIRKVQ